MDHVVDGEADDAAERLCVEQDDSGRDPGPERKVMAGQEAAEQLHPLVLAWNSCGYGEPPPD